MSRPVPARPPRRTLLRRLLSMLIAVAVLAAGLFVDSRRALDTPLALREASSFVIAPGSPLPKVLAQAQAAGLFASGRQARYLGLLARYDGSAQAIKAGEYRIEPGLTPRGLLALWVSGRTVLHELRLIEGWRFADAVRQVRATPTLTATLAADLDEAGLMAALGRPGQRAEGRLFPDTYRHARGTDDVVVLRQALAAQDAVLAEEWAARQPGLPYDSAEQALVMASIVEKETGVAAERPAIAGVFVRRLKLGMRLQTDPTVIYGLGAAYDGDLRKRDLVTDTPYNTYTRDGLPPTPICLPGREAIHAALHPADGDALYFVARGDGSHQFSATLDEHNAAVRRYQLRGGAR